MQTFSLKSLLPAPTEVLDFQQVKENPSSIPTAPGVYVFERTPGDYAYSGKAESLRRRIATHLSNTHNDGLREDLAADRIEHLLLFVCETELDATVLERYFIEGGYYRGEHNIQFTRKTPDIPSFDEDPEVLSDDDYQALLRQEQDEVDQMLIEDREKKLSLFSRLATRLQENLDDHRAHGNLNTEEFYYDFSRSLFSFLFNYVQYTGHRQLNWTAFKEELGTSIDQDTVDLIDRIIGRSRFRTLLHNKFGKKAKFMISAHNQETAFIYESFFHYYALCKKRNVPFLSQPEYISFIRKK